MRARARGALRGTLRGALAVGAAIEAFPPVVLLDQCSGRSWTLGFRAGPGGHDWRLLRRQGID